jgi:hypothetical protein
MRRKLSIGILIDDFNLPLWEYQIIYNLIKSDFARIALVIKDNPPSDPTGKNGSGMTRILIRVLERADRLLFKSKHDYYLRKSIVNLISDSQVIDLDSQDRSHYKPSEKQIIGSIKDLDLDIIIKLGGHYSDIDILEIPRYGTWGFSLNSKNNTCKVDAGYWEVVNYSSVTNSSLEILHSGQARNEIIFASRESTSPFSINVSRNKVFWRASLFIPRIIKGLHENGDDYLARLKIRFRSSISETKCEAEIPSFLKTTWGELKYVFKVTGLTLRKLYYTDAFSWHLLIGKNTAESGYSTDFKNFKRIPKPNGIFWADPFIVKGSESYYLFVEEFSYKKDKAHISVLELDIKGNLLKSERIIERPYHMSYPFIFKVNGTYYMIPETGNNRTIELYKCNDFPYKWEFEGNIMENICATDTTLFYHNNKWWMFTTIDQTGNISGCSTELFLFFSDDVLKGKWKSHPMNPIVSDSGNARMAGNLFVSEGQICRPSQDCSMRYGRGLNINHVTKLTEEEYNETSISRYKPDWDKRLRGIHTLNFENDFTIVDVYSYHSRLSF